MGQLYLECSLKDKALECLKVCKNFVDKFKTQSMSVDLFASLMHLDTGNEVKAFSHLLNTFQKKNPANMRECYINDKIVKVLNKLAEKNGKQEGANHIGEQIIIRHKKLCDQVMAIPSKRQIKPVVDYLNEALDVPVKLVKDYLNGVELNDGELVILENVRFNKGEKNDDETLSKQYAALCDIFVMDARNYVEFTKKKYDIIIVDVSQPFLSNTNSLFSKEFYTICKQKLTDDGIKNV